MKLEPADIIITADKKSLLSVAILSVLNFFQKDEVKYQHVMMAIDDELCIEALNKITINIIRDRMRDFKRFKIIRNRNLTPQQKMDIVARAKKMVRMRYGYGRLFLQFLDQAFNTNYFTKRIKDPTYQICSSLVAWCYDVETGIRFNGVNWAATEPDDIDDESIKNSTDWFILLEWERP